MLTIVGGGAFGTALATTYAQTHDVNLWSRNASTLLQSRISHRLPDVHIPQAVTITDDLAALHQATVLLALPMQQLGAFLETLPAETQPLALIACCKGIDLNTGLVVPVSSLICCIIAKSIVYILPMADRLTSSSDASYAACEDVQ